MQLKCWETNWREMRCRRIIELCLVLVHLPVGVKMAKNSHELLVYAKCCIYPMESSWKGFL